MRTHIVVGPGTEAAGTGTCTLLERQRRSTAQHTVLLLWEQVWQQLLVLLWV